MFTGITHTTGSINQTAGDVPTLSNWANCPAEVSGQGHKGVGGYSQDTLCSHKSPLSRDAHVCCHQSLWGVCGVQGDLTLSAELLKIGQKLGSCSIYEVNKSKSFYLADVPDCLLRVNAPVPRKRKRRGVQAGRLVKLKAWLALSPDVVGSSVIPQDYRTLLRYYLSRRTSVSVGTWLLPVVGELEEIYALCPRRSSSSRASGGGVIPGNLQTYISMWMYRFMLSPFIFM
ncbi:hypothetical protein WMY93_004489 [Mugilogobius chulae]|uniref:Uncharacterized protein n=1 Tax=Mugilogobius chulae TaxID=88201 RepID=A0AAW0PRB0_9GOBI